MKSKDIKKTFGEMTTFIYCQGPPLYDSDNNIVTKSCTDRINDTTDKGGIPVFLHKMEVGRAVRLEKIVVEGVSMLKYEVDLTESLVCASLSTFVDGYAGTVSGAMWINGFYPQKIRLTSANRDEKLN